MITPEPTEGTFDFSYAGSTYQTYYKLFGDLKSSQATPLIILNGGPGSPHLYCLPHRHLNQRGFPVLFYDQLGTGKSTHLKDKPSDFWTIDLYLAELDNVIKHFGLGANFSLLGHSWGGMLAMEYSVARQPAGLRRLVLADTLASFATYIEGVNALLSELPQELQDAISKNEAAGTFDDPGYQNACTVFYKKHMCRVDPWPKEMQEGFAAMEEDKAVYLAMQGPSEFTITGSLKEWSITERLHAIKVPTLILSGDVDTAQPVTVEPLFQNIARSKWVQLANAGHCSFYDQPASSFLVLATH
ncbi:proline-specific peptidase [Peniophora sp. CONT]|nr:proline-specific peptidase [Peniophora sp. CONT]